MNAWGSKEREMGRMKMFLILEGMVPVSYTHLRAHETSV